MEEGAKNEDEEALPGNETDESVGDVLLEEISDQELYYHHKDAVGTSTSDDENDLEDLLEASSISHRCLLVEGNDCRNPQYRDAKEESKSNDAPPPQALEETTASKSNNSDEKRLARIRNPFASIEQAGSRDCKMPLQRIQDHTSEHSKTDHQTMASAAEGAMQKRVGAFRDSGGEPTRTAAAGLEEDETTCPEQQDEEHVPLSIIHATLVVEDDLEITRQQQDSHASHPVEEGSEITESPDTGSSDIIAARDLHPNVVVENVTMDEALTEHPRTPQLVEASPLYYYDQKGLCEHRKTRMLAVGLVVFTIVLGIGIFFGVNSSDDDEKALSKPPPNHEMELGNTTESFVRDVLPHYSRAALEDPRSAQSQALAWLWKDPNTTSMLPNFRRVQRFALATTFFALAALSDRENAEQVGWLTEEHECTWITNYAPATVCQNEEFQAIDMRNFGLSGSIPPEMGLLTKLFSIDISDNPIVGTLPTELGLLTRLDQFGASNCALTGSIPTEIGLWSVLRLCFLSNNQLTSTVPTEFGRLAALRVDLDSNMLTGTLPSEIGQMFELQMLLLHNNILTGTIPTEFGRMTNLQRISLSHNDMNGELPTELGNLTNILLIYFHGNNFSGMIPNELGGLFELRDLTLHDTILTGSVPLGLCELFDSGELTYLAVNCTGVSCSCNCDCSSTLA